MGEREEAFFDIKLGSIFTTGPSYFENKEDVMAAVSGFGELWEVDAASKQCSNVSFFRLRIHC